LHDPWDVEQQYRLTVQRFSRLPPELSVRKVSFEEQNQRYFGAYYRALPHTQAGGQVNANGRRQRGAKAAKAEDIERSARRARQGLRKQLKELAPDLLLTLTSRHRLKTLDLAYVAWGQLLRAIRQADPDFAGVVVPELHGSGEHIHLHVACRGLTLRPNSLRRLWHIVLEGLEGRECSERLKGSAAPGNVDYKHHRGKSIAEAARKIAKYLGKYLSKDMVRQFGRRAYSPTKNIRVAQAQRYYLDALTPEGARREALELIGVHPDWHEAVRFWAPDDKVQWAELPAALWPPPPPF
jgi:hypothetical protein